MRIITGCLRPTPTDLLPVLAGIGPASLRVEKATHRLAQQAVLDENHAPNQLAIKAQPGKRQRLKSRHLFYEKELFLHTSKPVLYFRYVNDTFAIGNKKSDCYSFLTALNRLYLCLLFSFKKKLKANPCLDI